MFVAAGNWLFCAVGSWPVARVVTAACWLGESGGDTEQMADDDDVRLPLVLGPVSNGEFLPLAAGPADVRLARAVLDRAAAAADALAMDRRLFLQTAGGMAALLTTINLAACTAAWQVSGFTASPARLVRGWRPRPA